MDCGLEIVRRLEQNLAFDSGVANREWIWHCFNGLVYTYPFKFFNSLELVSVLIILGLFQIELVIRERNRIWNGLSVVDRHPHEFSEGVHTNLLKFVEKFNLTGIYQHGDMLSFEVFCAFSLHFDVDPEDFFRSVIHITVKAQIKGVRAKELRHVKMSLSHFVNRFNAAGLVKLCIAAWVHLNIMKFTIVRTPIDNVMRLNAPIRRLKSFRSMLLKILPPRNRNCKHKIVTILPYFDRFRVEALLDKRADNWHFCPLISVEPHLEDTVKSDDSHDAESAEGTKASIKTIFAVKVESDTLSKHVTLCSRSPKPIPRRQFSLFRHSFLF